MGLMRPVHGGYAEDTMRGLFPAALLVPVARGHPQQPVDQSGHQWKSVTPLHAGHNAGLCAGFSLCTALLAPLALASDTSGYL